MQESLKEEVTTNQLKIQILEVQKAEEAAVRQQAILAATQERARVTTEKLVGKASVSEPVLGEAGQACISNPFSDSVQKGLGKASPFGVSGEGQASPFQ